MSSPRPKEASNGVICQNTSAHGPIRLPESAADAFVREFNRTYAAIGMSAQAIPGITPHPKIAIEQTPTSLALPPDAEK